MRVISLTSIPPRFSAIGPTLESLLAQGADRVVLALPRHYRRFPGPMKPPPLPGGVTLLWSDTDFGPATKLLPALRAYPQAEITYCDDDVIYGAGWLDALAGPEDRVTAASGWSVRRLRRQGVDAPQVDVAQGFSGVRVSAHLFDAALFDLPPAAQAVDDIWISGHLARARIPITLSRDARALCEPRTLDHDLQDAEIDGLSRAQANERCAAELHARYGIWPPLSN
ncbi:hypothetical protein [Pseudoponticoccus marisrubri]|uniref:Glycosyltransferase n=1 Tax=Pseudoponticoccus marisrubri TaxID=1685382 RepID=A0A0W7WFP0_9RHOB|nr:hypothetical protein [Pseudoponticoccus marisrubri]KUF09425.1 hypothetical protein AVJ23_17440 [Pseudoponticoccus marisrubri]